MSVPAGVRRLAPSLSILAAAAAFLVWGHAYEGRSQAVPVLVGWAAVVLCLLDAVASTDSGVGRVLRGVLSGRPLDGGPDEGPDEGGGGAAAVRPAVACAWTLAFTALAAAVGFIAAVPAYTFAFMRLQAGMPWRRCLATAAAVAAVVWLVFERLLSYRVFEGAVFGGQF